MPLSTDTDNVQAGSQRGGWLVVAGFEAPAEARDEIEHRFAPRIEYLELAKLTGAGAVGQRADFGRAFGARRVKVAQAASAVQAALRRGKVDTIYATGEDISFFLAPLLSLLGWKGRLITIVHNCGAATARKLMRLIPRGERFSFVCFCLAQQRLLVDELGVREDAVVRLANPVDHDFFQPQPGAARDSVFAAGREMRDYDTLVRAAAGARMPFRISASGFLATADGPRAAPPNVSVLSKRVSYAEIRRLYNDARLVVVPLRPSSYAAGVNGVLEAMAMAKPVVVTRSPGIEEYVRDGVTGRVTPPSDPQALRAAIDELWADPERCAAIGASNRRWVEENCRIEDYCRSLAALEAARPWSMERRAALAVR